MKDCKCTGFESMNPGIRMLHGMASMVSSRQAGCYVTTVESVLFELLRSKDASSGTAKMAFRGLKLEFSGSRGDFATKNTCVRCREVLKNLTPVGVADWCWMQTPCDSLHYINAWNGFKMLRPEFKAISNIVKAYGEKLKKHKASVVEAWPWFPFFLGGGKGCFQFSGFGFFGWRLVDTVLSYVFYVTFT